jgi:hypothetical protein
VEFEILEMCRFKEARIIGEFYKALAEASAVAKPNLKLALHGFDRYTARVCVALRNLFSAEAARAENNLRYLSGRHLLVSCTVPASPAH